MSGLSDALARSAFSVGHRDVSVADVVTAALYLSEWGGVDQRARAGMAALESSDVDEEAVRATAEAFRRPRRLLAAEEMEAWFSRRGLTAGTWMRWVRSDVARRAAGGAAAGADAPAVGATALYVEGLCSGALARSAQWLAEVVLAEDAPPSAPSAPRRVDAAALASLGVDQDRADQLLDELIARRGALDRLADRIAGPDAVEARIRAHPSDWLEVEYRVVLVADDSAAREAILCVRDDGMALEEVAELAGSNVRGERALLAEAPPTLRDHLLSATPGELVGPLGVDDGSAVLLVDRKVAPSPQSAEISRRLRSDLLRSHLDREVSARVRWHDRL
jgi:hypothetical protein